MQVLQSLLPQELIHLFFFHAWWHVNVGDGLIRSLMQTTPPLTLSLYHGRRKPCFSLVHFISGLDLHAAGAIPVFFWIVG
jgi:hypothetical protein